MPPLFFFSNFKQKYRKNCSFSRYLTAEEASVAARTLPQLPPFSYSLPPFTVAKRDVRESGAPVADVLHAAEEGKEIDLTRRRSDQGVMDRV